MLVADTWPGDGRLVAQVERVGVVAARWRPTVLIDSALHLLQNLINLLQITLGAQVGHGRQVVVLVKGTLLRVVAADRRERRSGGHVLRSNTAGVNAQCTVKGHQRASDLAVTGRVEAPTLGLAKKLVQVIISTSAVVATTVAQRLGAVVNWLLVVSHRGTVGLSGVLRVVASVRRPRSPEGCGTSPHLAVVVVEAGWALGSAIGGGHATMLILGRPDEDAVIGVGLDMLLEILGAFERLSAEVALMRLERNVNSNVRGDVITLDGGSATRVPLACEVQVVGALPSDVLLAQMILAWMSAMRTQGPKWVEC